MGWIDSLLAGGTGSIVEKTMGAVERLSAGHLGKKELRLELAKIADEEAARMHTELTTEIQAKERIMVAEMAQSDNYTKRARPSVVYFGLIAFGVDQLVRYAAHFFGTPIPETQIPQEFWMAWGSVVGIYSIGRSAEKRGGNGKLTQAVTGTPSAPSIL